MSTDLDALGRFRLQDYFELVYLPDFEEQYVIDPRANLGSLDLQLTRGPGGELLALGMQVDNRAVTGPIVDAWEKLVQAGVSAGTSAMGFPREQVVSPPTPAHSLLADRLAPQAQTSVTLRVHVVRMASPGLYPILKASEVVRGRQRSCPESARAAETHVLPVYPYSRVAYQVHDTIVVEHLVPAASSPATTARRRAFASAASAATPPTAFTDVQLTEWLAARLSAAGALRCMRIASVRRSPPAAPRSGIESLEIRIACVDADGQARSASPSPAALQRIQELVLGYEAALPSLQDAKVLPAGGE